MNCKLYIFYLQVEFMDIVDLHFLFLIIIKSLLFIFSGKLIIFLLPVYAYVSMPVIIKTLYLGHIIIFYKTII